MMTTKELIKQLESDAKDLAAAGVNGYERTMLDAAEELRFLLNQVDELKDEVDELSTREHSRED